MLLVSSGDGLDKLAASLFSRFSDLQSERGRLPPVQSHSVEGRISQPSVIQPSVCQPSVADPVFVGVSAPPSGGVFI